MIDAIKAIDTGKHSIVLKWQLSLPDGINEPLNHDVFDYAYTYGNEQGYKVTSSVADLESLKFLLQYDIPFVKIPNDRSLDWMIGEVPRKIPVYVSYGNNKELEDAYCQNVKKLLCISKYPASVADYEENFDLNHFIKLMGYGISDHTTGFALWYEYPEIYEIHFRLESSTGPDAGSFAKTPKQLEEIL
jgi:sialic acid synthase SpsE